VLGASRLPPPVVLLDYVGRYQIVILANWALSCVADPWTPSGTSKACYTCCCIALSYQHAQSILKSSIDIRSELYAAFVLHVGLISLLGQLAHKFKSTVCDSQTGAHDEFSSGISGDAMKQSNSGEEEGVC
jgi:hypothetical protein